MNEAKDLADLKEVLTGDLLSLSYGCKDVPKRWVERDFSPQDLGSAVDATPSY